ncbi:MAG: peptidyl-prolyl cis-trans isomerase [Chitinophagaceae bacterium]|nr:peptidyl-prolyl cis-trans isomerase [Chitinophagaceae bacterium]
MSVIQRIREKGAWIIFGIIALALLAFILQDSAFRRGNLFSNNTTIGKVNGQTVDRTDFQAKSDLVNQMNGGQIPQEQLVPGVWNMMVDQIVLEQQYKKLGLAFTGKELSDVLFGNNPPQWFTQRFTDPATGQFNEQAAREEINQIKKLKNDPRVAQYYQVYIQPTIDQSLRQKYQSLISGAIYVPKWMNEKMNADNNSIASISYVQAPYTLIPDNQVKVSDADIRDYEKKHESEFEQKEETRSISYVAFEAGPSAQDSEEAFKQVSEIKPAFATAPDVKNFVSTKGSETPYFDGYVTSNNMKMPYADTIKSLGIGQVFGPYVDGGNYVVARMIAKRSMPDSVKVRHILIKTADRGQPVLPDSIAKKRIDSIANAIKGGADFNAMVQQFSDDPSSKPTKGEYEFPSSQFSTISKEFAEVAFYGNTGDKKIVKVENSTYSGYHYIEVVQQKNIQPAYNVAYFSKPIVISPETDNNASTAAQQFAAGSKTSKEFSQNAQKLKMTPLVAADIKANDFTVGPLTASRQLVRWVYEKDNGDVSEPMKIGDRYIVATVTGINKAGQMSVTSARPLAEPFIRNEKKAKIIIDTKIKGNSLEEIAKSVGSSVQRADSIAFQTPFIPNVGNEPKIIGAAFNKQVQGKQTTPISGNTGVFILRGEGVSAKPSMGNDPAALQNNLKAQAAYRALDALHKSAEIKDYRSKFY